MHTSAPGRPQTFLNIEPESIDVLSDGIVISTQWRTLDDLRYCAMIVWEEADDDNRAVRGVYDEKDLDAIAQDAIELVRKRRDVRETEGEVAYRTRAELWE